MQQPDKALTGRLNTSEILSEADFPPRRAVKPLPKSAMLITLDMNREDPILERRCDDCGKKSGRTLSRMNPAMYKKYKEAKKLTVVKCHSGGAFANLDKNYSDDNG